MIWSHTCGSFAVFAIEDGWFFRSPFEQFPDSDRGIWGPRVEGMVDGRLRISIGCFVVTDGSRTVMVDAGAGEDPTPLGEGAVTGRMPEALAMLGMRPDDVEAVVHTHFHVDHVGGDLTPGGEPFFPLARVVVQRSEVDHWTHAAGAAADRARRVLSALHRSGRLETVDGGSTVVSGVSVLPTPGHTPGHQSVMVSSRGSQVLITGDVTHHPVQIAHPEWGIPFDVDPDTATATRQHLLRDVTGTGIALAAGHYPRPGVGYVEELGTGRVFLQAPVVQVA
jgi:glyoxylase-like metal-dependent hydrolase (beta-lactamase superfamily II)